jgi:hypothetical protein
MIILITILMVVAAPITVLYLAWKAIQDAGKKAAKHRELFIIKQRGKTLLPGVF